MSIHSGNLKKKGKTFYSGRGGKLDFDHHFLVWVCPWWRSNDYRMTDRIGLTSEDSIGNSRYRLEYGAAF